MYRLLDIGSLTKKIDMLIVYFLILKFVKTLNIMANEIRLTDGSIIKLTEKELMFCEYYLGDSKRNATTAAIEAGYSVKNARFIATQNLSKLHIQKFLKYKMAPVLEKLGITQEAVLAEFAAIGMARIGNYMNDDYSMKELGSISDFHQAAMESVEVTTRSIGGDENIIEKKVKFKQHDKLKALDRLYEVLNPEGVRKDDKGNFFQNIYNQINITK